MAFSLPPPDTIRESLSYNAETGTFTWIKPRKHVRVGSLAGTLSSRGYASITFDRRCYQAHRLAWFFVYGNWPRQIDHIDCVKMNNRINNLREVNTSENAQNMRKAFSNNKSGALGVTILPNGRFQAQIGVNGTNKYLGCFKTPEAAHEAYVTAKRAFHPAGCL